jgi:hypothetical protein
MAIKYNFGIKVHIPSGNAGGSVNRVPTAIRTTYVKNAVIRL